MLINMLAKFSLGFCLFDLEYSNEFECCQHWKKFYANLRLLPEDYTSLAEIALHQWSTNEKETLVIDLIAIEGIFRTIAT